MIPPPQTHPAPPKPTVSFLSTSFFVGYQVEAGAHGRAPPTRIPEELPRASPAGPLHPPHPGEGGLLAEAPELLNQAEGDTLKGRCVPAPLLSCQISTAGLPGGC